MTVDHPHCPPVSTLVALLRWRAAHQPDALGYTHLVDGERQEDHRSWSALDLRARAVAAWLQARGARGERALLLLDEGNTYLDGLFGCLYAGVLAVPAHPPDPKRLTRTLPRLQTLAADAGVRFVLTSRAIAEAARPHLTDDPVLAAAAWIAIESLDAEGADGWLDPELAASDLAYLQYTSGSTAAPKGVMISHHNLLHQLGDFDTGYAHTPASCLVSWLPPTHDLGLVYGRLMGLFVGMRTVSLTPAAFMQRPIRWLQALDRYRGTHSPSPNFGFEVVARKTRPEERAGLDLSSVRVVLNGAEAIREQSEALFLEALVPHGLSPAAVTHAMGMSESTAKIVTEPIDRSPALFAYLDPDALQRGEVVRVPRDHPSARAVASCGSTVLDTRAVIVDPTTLQALGQDRVGELWVAGTTVAQGYWNNPEATEATFRAHTASGDGPFLRTGDLAFDHDGEIYLTGRLKDLVIVRGQNHHPQDVEWSLARAVSALRPNCAAAFAVERSGEEQLAAVAEVYPERVGDSEAVFAAMRQAIFEDHGLRPAALLLLPPRTLPKTSSGKIQRNESRRRFLEGEFQPIARWEAAAIQPAAAPEPTDLRRRLAVAVGRQRERILLGFLTERTAQLTGLDPADIEPDQPLGELGLDSVSAVEMVESVGRALGRTLDGTLLFDHPTLQALAAFLLPEDPSGSTHPARARPAINPTAPGQDVAAMTDEEATAALLAELDDL